MFCSKCGREAADPSDLYCAKCGRQFGPGSNSAPMRYQIAQTHLREVKFRRIQGIHDVRLVLRGASGEVLVQTDIIRQSYFSSGNPIVDDSKHLRFLQDLLNNGWEQTPPMPGDPTCGTRLRRLES